VASVRTELEGRTRKAGGIVGRGCVLRRGAGAGDGAEGDLDREGN